MTLRRSISIILAIVFVYVGLAASLATAQEGGSGLQISPTRNEVVANAGEQKVVTITLKNITTGELTANVVLNDFESDNTTGTPKILVDSSARTPYSLSKMLQGLQNVELKPGESKEVKLTVNIPKNAAPGAYFGAVRYSVVPKSTSPSERQIALNASIAHLVFVEVPGEVVQQIKVNSLKVQRGDKASSFFFSPPNKAALSVQNLGNGFARPFGKVIINNGFGKEVDSYDVNNREPKGIVLPNSSRIFTDDISGVKIPGKYTAIASVAYGNGGEVVTYKSAFWYLPVWFLAILLVVIMVIVGGGYRIYKKRFSNKSSRRK